MSLYKQLWIAIVLLLILVFGITFASHGFSSSRYLEEQLNTKNRDDAAFLALALSQQAVDPAALNRLFGGQLHKGAYEYIQFRDPGGNILFDEGNAPGGSEAPDWLTGLFPIYAVAGSAEVVHQGGAVGEVSLKNYGGFAHDELWADARQMLITMVVAILLAGVASTFLIRLLLKPLDQVVAQAQALGQRRFLTSPEPFTTEFAELTSTMNDLTGRIQDMLKRESQRLERTREVSEMDVLTGVLLRGPFLDRLKAKLDSETFEASGSVALVRIADLARMNQSFGRQPVDAALKGVGEALRRHCITYSNSVAGRLNGSDFCLITPQEPNPKKAAEDLQKLIHEVLRHHDMADGTTLPGACVDYLSGDTTAQVMTALDASLMTADDQGNSTIAIASRRTGAVVAARTQAAMWKKNLTHALENEGLLMEAFPVVDAKHELLHFEGMVRVRVDGEVRSAGEFMPWVHRLDLGADIDRAVIKLAIERILVGAQPVCVNLTVSSLTDPTFAPWLEELLSKQKQTASYLSMEVGESNAYTYSDGFKRLSSRARSAGANVGIEHVGHQISDVGKLAEMGVAYIKVDSIFIEGIDKNPGKSALLLTYVNIAHSLGLKCIAEGVSNEEELAAVIDIGVSGASGPGVSWVDA